jgi:hypothetical protein
MIIAEKIKEVVIGKNEAGLFEFKDTNVTIEMGDVAFVIREENVFAGTVDNVYFKKRENAEKYS